MNLISQFDFSNLHHAYIVENTPNAFGTLTTHFKETRPADELYCRNIDSFSIQDSRELIKMASMKSVGTQFFIYRIHTISREAQNALLKIVEEPPERTHFFFLVSSLNDLLPTLLSRSFTIANNEHTHKSAFGEDFVNAPIGSRLKLLEPIVKEKDMVRAEELLCMVETVLYEKKEHARTMYALTHIATVHKVLHDKGASLKVLLESVALLTPQFQSTHIFHR